MKMRGSIGYHYLYMFQHLAFCGIPCFEIPAFGTGSRASGEESPFDWPPRRAPPLPVDDRLVAPSTLDPANLHFLTKFIGSKTKVVKVGGDK